MAADPLRIAVADNTLLTAMMRALKESLEPGPIVASFANTGVYPWNSEKIQEQQSGGNKVSKARGVVR